MPLHRPDPLPGPEPVVAEYALRGAEQADRRLRVRTHPRLAREPSIGLADRRRNRGRTRRVRRQTSPDDTTPPPTRPGCNRGKRPVKKSTRRVARNDAAYRKKLIEVSLPLEAINKASAKEKSIRHGHPSTLHLWWARRPLAACRAVLFASLVDDPDSDPDEPSSRARRASTGSARNGPRLHRPDRGNGARGRTRTTRRHPRRAGRNRPVRGLAEDRTRRVEEGNDRCPAARPWNAR